MGPDIVYVVRKGDYNEELRYSLRSLVNLPHDRVWIVGHCPSWVRQRFGYREGVYHWPREQKGSKYRNANESLVEITKELGTSLSSPFLLFNDDFYIMRPIDEVPVLTLGKALDVIDLYRRRHHRGAYWRGMVDTWRLLQDNGHSDPMSYEVHAPMPIYREPLLEAWAMGKHLEVLHIRTVMGNLAGLEGKVIEDCKVYRAGDYTRIRGPFLSSNETVLPPVRDAFPNPSRYELD